MSLRRQIDIDTLALRLNRNVAIALLIHLTALLARLLPVRNRSGLFLFFPFCHTGGAEQVHAEISNCFSGKRPWVILTKRSDDNSFRQRFEHRGRLFDIWWFCKYCYPFSIGLMAGIINSHREPRLFGSNSLFYALLLPYLRPDIHCADLIHAFGGKTELFTLPVAARLNRRVVINRTTMNQLEQQYTQAGLDPSLNQRIVIIPNRVKIPATIPPKQWQLPLTALYVGRGGQEKRVGLIIQTARRCQQAGLPVRFRLVGVLAEQLPADAAYFCQLDGIITDQAELERLYQDGDLILISSSREGFPLTVMEGMARGCVPLCTKAGGIPEHISHLENGWLLPAEDDTEVVEQMYQGIERFCSDLPLLQQLSANAVRYAAAHFDNPDFCSSYRKVIKG